MDGLVLDSETGYVTAWQQAAEAMGFPLGLEFLGSLSGLHGETVQQQLQKHCGHEFDINRFNRLSSEYWHLQVRQQGIPIKKGFFSLLKLIEAFGLPFCLATNSRRSEALHCLDLAGLGRVFPAIVARDDVAQGKPAADIFIKSATVLGKGMDECLVLEDSPVGVAAAIAAGAPCLYVPSVYPVDDRSANHAIAVLNDLEQVADFISVYQQGIPYNLEK